jgi:hypothetical protein
MYYHELDSAKVFQRRRREHALGTPELDARWLGTINILRRGGSVSQNRAPSRPVRRYRFRPGTSPKPPTDNAFRESILFLRERLFAFFE